MKELGYDQLVCDIFVDWEHVKDEILPTERKAGLGNGTIHVFLGAADEKLRKEFPSYYSAVNEGEDPSIHAINIKHYFLENNVISMLGHMCKYCFEHEENIAIQIDPILSYLASYNIENGLMTTNSLFKLSTGSNKLRPYFKQFDSDGVFSKLIRRILLPNSAYKISLFKNSANEYAAFWLIGFENFSDFEVDSSKIHLLYKNSDNRNHPRQQIFYGAPGTGKSNTIKCDTELAEKEGRVFRTTFHPDSDYSTFVGCYKPRMKSADRIYSAEELAVKLKEIKNSGVTYPCHKFAAQYWRSLKDLSADTIKQILIACEFTETMNVEISKGVAIGQEYLNKDEDGKIIYTFTPQAFTNAYVKAWNTEEDVYLIIEEINRGNCAQIFGDLFQLLDRKNGVSEYPIDADADLANYLSKKLASSTHKDITDEIREGKKLKLPSNLYIWATMNTSDQSLFPIDSAFKRRWDWKYMKIRNHPEENYKIKLSDKEYDWWEFIQRINEIIASMTSSANKQLGYFFCKAAGDGTISPETFVSKVIFYLWNDVFKDYGFEDESLFSYKEIVEGTEERKELTFPDFYDEDGEKVNEVRLKGFLDSVMNWKKDEENK